MLLAISLKICLSSLQSKSLDHSYDKCPYNACHPSFTLQASLTRSRPSLLLTSNDCLKLNGVTFLHEYLNIRPNIFKIL